LQWRQRRENSIVAGVMQFVHAAHSRRLNAGSALCGKTSGLSFHHRQFPILRHAAATHPPPLGEADKLLPAYQGI
jgi:hypothetical protein